MEFKHRQATRRAQRNARRNDVDRAYCKLGRKFRLDVSKDDPAIPGFGHGCTTKFRAWNSRKMPSAEQAWTSALR